MKFNIFSLAILFTVSAYTAHAQTGTPSAARFSIGAEAGVPTGPISSFYNLSAGGSLQLDVPVAEQLFFTVNAGYTQVFGSSRTAYLTTITYNDMKLLPFKAGLKFFPTKIFYVQGEVGALIALNKKELFFDKSTALTYGPQLGVLLPTSSKHFLDIGIRYQTGSSFVTNDDFTKLSLVGLRLGYAF